MLKPNDAYPFCRVRVIEPNSTMEPYKKGDEGVIMKLGDYQDAGMYFVKFDHLPEPRAVLFVELEAIE